MSDPSPLVFELCTAIDRFYERKPDLSVGDVLEALDELGLVLRGLDAMEQSGPNVVSISDYRRHGV
jgi:hypothetical protein